MSGTTSRLGLGYAQGSDNLTAFPAQNQANMTTLDGAVLYSEGLLANRPTAAIKGRIYRATDVGTNGTVYMDTGAAWFVVSPDTPEAAFSVYRTIAERHAQMPSATSAGTYALMLGPAVALGLGGVPTSPGSGSAGMYLDPADYTAGSRTTKYRIRAFLATNQVAPGITITFGLYPYTLSYGASGLADTISFGTVTAGSTVGFATPSASSNTQNNSGDFTAPAAGFYMLAVLLSGADASGALVDLHATLQMRQV